MYCPYCGTDEAIEGADGDTYTCEDCGESFRVVGVLIAGDSELLPTGEEEEVE